MKIKCDNCGNEFKFGYGVISLVCQQCGCYDLRFDTPVVATPSYLGELSPNSVVVEAHTSFYGLHVNGNLWNLSESPKVMEKLPEPEDLSEQKQEPEKAPKEELLKVVLPITGAPKEEESKPEAETKPEVKPALIKPKKRRPRWLNSGKE